MLRTHCIKIFTLCLVLSAAIPTWHASANSIDFEPVVGTITGQGNDLAIFEFDVLTGVTLELTLTDLATPAPFTVMGLALTDEFGGIFEQVTGVDELLINFDADPGTYLAIVGGIADADTNIGTFGLEISNVPVPGAAVLLGSALIGFATLSRRQQRATN